MSLLEERMRTPTNMGVMQDPDGVGAVGNPACGDVVTIYLRVRGGRIVEASFDSIGSVYQLATASVLCDCVTGESFGEARRRGPDCVLKRLPDLPDRHNHLARLALDALNQALDQVEGTDVVVPDAEEDTVCEEEARDVVLELVAGGKRWSTGEVEAVLEAEGKRPPMATVKLLSGMQRDGLLEGAMDAKRRAYRWWRTA